MNHIRLAYFGLLPFLAAIAISLFLESEMIIYAFIIYSISILNFVCGSMWQATATQTPREIYLAVLPSILLPLGLFFSLKLCLILLAIVYAFVLLAEQTTQRWSTLSPEYQQMRRKITSIVIICHLAMAAFINHDLS